MKNVKPFLVVGAVILLMFVAFIIVSSSAFRGESDMEKFANPETWCSGNQILVNPKLLPTSGCFSIENGHGTTGKVGNHDLEIQRTEEGKIVYTLDGVSLVEHYDPNKNDHVYSSPLVTTRGPDSWRFCNDVEHLDCPLEIDSMSDSADKTATSTKFSIANCSGGDRNGTCQFGKVIEKKGSLQ